MTTKRCARCERKLDADEFRPIAAMRDGLDSWCKECHLERTRQWRAEHPEKIAARNAARREGPFEKTCALYTCRVTFLGARRASRFCPRHRRARDRRSV